VLFWIFAGLIGLASIALMMRPVLSRSQDEDDGNAADISVYRDQLRELDVDVARGIVAPQEAEAARVEISRRLLAADAQNLTGAKAAPIGASTWMIAALCALMATGFLSYKFIGAPGTPDLPLAERLNAPRIDQIEAEKKFAETGPPPRILSETEGELLTKLREILTDRPNDLRGHRLLVQTLDSLSDFAPAWRAQAEVVRILGAEATGEDLAEQAELMIFAAGGYVSPEAQNILAIALQMEPSNRRGRYYSGAALAQNRQPELAMEIWGGLLNEGPNLPWKEPLREQVRRLSAETGLPLPQGMLRGPTQEDMRNAQDMSEDDVQMMIQNMVDGLSERLATEGGSPPEWARLINALKVKGNVERARAIYAEALTTFAGDEAALEAINQAAEGL